MKITEVDKNLADKTGISSGLDSYHIPDENFKLYGVIYTEDLGFIRMPKEIASKVSEGVDFLNRHTSGGRLIFSTNSKYIGVHAKYDDFYCMHHMARVGEHGFTLLERTEKGEKFVAQFSPEQFDNEGFSSNINVNSDGGFKTYVLYFPLYGRITDLIVDLDESSEFGKPMLYKDVKPILYYGSSITQGGCASRPDNDYQSIICDKTNIDFINLGFSGNAKGEQVISDYISSIDCSIFVYDYDHNAPDYEHLKATHEPLFKNFRKTHPDTPVIMISKPDLYRDLEQNIRRRELIYNDYLKAKNNGDNNVYFIDGYTLYPDDIREHCTVDGCHPTDLGFYFMAKAILKVMTENNLV